jgi:hypothetical protein
VPEIPEEAVTAAVDAVLAQPGLAAEDLRPWVRWIATTVLEAAAPAMAEAVAEKITAHMEAHGPQAGTPLGGTLRRAWRRHFGIAAQVAHFAFSTDEDIKQATAAALQRGDFAACYLDETGNPVAGPREDRERD